MSSSKAQYRQLGKSGLRVSVPILGAMSIGSKKSIPWCIEEEEALPLLKAAYDLGITSWDTANIYSNGESEKIIGKAVKKYNLPRHKLIIMTKCFNPIGETLEIKADTIRDDTNKDYVNQHGLSRAAIFNAVEASLERLDMKYIDLLQCHRFDPTTPIEETMSALNDLVRSGKVRYIGMSSCFAWQFEMMQNCAEKNGWTKFISMQNHYSLLYREEEREVNAYCNYTGVGLIPWGPLAAGSLARPASDLSKTARGETKDKQHISGGSEHNHKAEDVIIGRVEELAKKHNCTMGQVALAWINKRVSSPIVGFSSVERMMEALEAQKVTLSADEEKYLEEAYLPHAISGHH
ncbi:hypothetical protein EMMF5_002356 [Cystobasidiomycetes sp. EMM_F5]